MKVVKEGQLPEDWRATVTCGNCQAELEVEAADFVDALAGVPGSAGGYSVAVEKWMVGCGFCGVIMRLDMPPKHVVQHVRHLVLERQRLEALEGELVADFTGGWES